MALGQFFPPLGFTFTSSMRQAIEVVEDTMASLQRLEPATGLNIAHPFPSTSAMTIGEGLAA
jgi:hypothetical protein